MKLFFAIFIFGWVLPALAFLPSSFRAEFSQEEKSLISGKVNKSEGSIEYRRPGRIRFEITKPNQLIFVGGPKKTWYYTAPEVKGESGEVTISPASNHPILKFFDILAKGLVDNESYTVKKDNGVASLDFSQDAQKEFNLKSAKITLNKEYSFLGLKEMAITLSDGKTITMKMRAISPNVALPESRFIFEIPKNTRQHRH